MKRLMTLAVCLLALALLTGCGGKYSDVEKINEEYVDTVENYIAALEKADDAKSVAKAMNTFTDELEVIWPKMRELADKYPELENEKNLPEELKESQKRAEEVGGKMAASFMKLMQYMDDPDVMAAQERMGKVMMQQ